MQCLYHSPIGNIVLSAKSGRLIGLKFDQTGKWRPEPRLASEPLQPVLDIARSQLDSYFAHRRKRLDVPVALMGSPFQLKVWSVLLQIGFGQTVSYRQLAERIGNPDAARAVGAANAANPLAIVVPCHRVIASDGTLAGFSGGVDVKRDLLDHERHGAGLLALACG